MGHDEITRAVIGAAIKVHKALGPGLLESAYQACMTYEVGSSGLQVEAQKPIPLIYEGLKLECGYRLDLVVERQVIVEIKAVEALHPIHVAQMLTYLKLTGCQVGLLMNFNVKNLVAGVRRVVNNYRQFSASSALSAVKTRS